MVGVSVNLKAAFDSMDRRVLIEEMRKRGVREELVDGVEELLRETKSKVRGKDGLGESFWTGRGIRQKCLLSTLLFNLLIADLEEEMKKGVWGGIRVGERKYIRWPARMIWCCWERSREK